MSRTQRSAVNYASSLLLQAITLATGILSTPLILNWLGDDRFGALRSAGDWLGHLKILELGLGGSLLPVLAIAVAQGNRAQVELTVAVGIRAYCKVLLLMLGAAVMLSFALLHLVPVQPSLALDLQAAYWIGVLGSFLLPLTPFRLLTEASQRSDIVNLSFVLQSLIITGASLYLAAQGMGMAGQAFAVIIGVIVATILISWKSIRQYPSALRIVFSAPTEAMQPIRKQLQKLSIPTLLYSLSGQIGLFTDNLVIAYFLGPASVVPFVMTQRLFAIAQSQVQSVGNATWSGLADLYAKGELGQFNLRLVQLTKLVVTSGLMLMIPILLYNPQFVQLWVGSERFAGMGVSTLAAINAVTMGVLSLWGWCFSGTGNIARIARMSMFASLLNISVSLLATPALKLTGPLLGTFVSFFGLYLWGMLYHLKHQFGSSPRALLAAIVHPCLLAALYVPEVAWFAHSYPPKSWIELGASMVFTAVIFLMLAWFTLLKPEERYQWRKRVMQLSPLPHL
ncbi:hypothetical protein NC981_18485 [Leptolyngbya sp. DQ-M1]|uniref:lipopolysaccharide biosynthesis protein n=1 Tax=Leptolyngbya sp. DQ-M1 TaxID=2933920 RepID=UPI0032988C2E